MKITSIAILQIISMTFSQYTLSDWEKTDELPRANWPVLQYITRFAMDNFADARSLYRSMVKKL